MKVKPSPEFKAYKQKCKLYDSLFAKAKMLLSFKKISTLKELYNSLGIEDGELDYVYFNGTKAALSNAVSHNDIKLLEAWYKYNLVKPDSANENNVNEHKEIEDKDAQIQRYKMDERDLRGECCESNLIVGERDRLSTQEGTGILHGIQSTQRGTTQPIVESGSFEIALNEQAANQEYKPENLVDDSPKQTAILPAFQIRAANRLLYGILRENKRAQLLRAGVGVGKTFIFGCVIRNLIDKGFFRDCVSPWPAMVITRASVVTQTSRVLENLFGIDLESECVVINIEQLRAKLGDYMLERKVLVKDGEEHEQFIWREPTNPKLIIVDESQLAKNIGSTQSKIIQSVSLIKRPIAFIASSATPFCRVTEAAYFAVNTHMKIG